MNTFKAMKSKQQVQMIQSTFFAVQQPIMYSGVSGQCFSVIHTSNYTQMLFK